MRLIKNPRNPQKWSPRNFPAIQYLSNYDDTIEMMQEEALANLGPIVEEATNVEIIRPTKICEGLGSHLGPHCR